jgi:glutathione peroxidase-family protein
LSSLVGKPILLDFSAYATENSIEHTFELREIYNKYSNQGLQIYQVSIDQNKLYWQQNVSNIPWTAVIDETGKALQFYNIREIPTLFLINKEGEIVGRYEDVHALKKDLSKVL